MKLNRNAEIALKIVETLKVNAAADNDPVRVTHLAKTAKTTVAFAEQVARKLRVAGVIESVRGPGGGYKISPTPVTALRVVQALGYSMSAGNAMGSTADKVRSRLYSALQDVVIT